MDIYQNCQSSGPGWKLWLLRTDTYFPLATMKIASKNDASFVFVRCFIKVTTRAIIVFLVTLWDTNKNILEIGKDRWSWFWGCTFQGFTMRLNFKKLGSVNHGKMAFHTKNSTPAAVMWYLQVEWKIDIFGQSLMLVEMFF